MTLPTVLDADAVEKLLPQIDVIHEVRQLFLELSQNKAVQPPQSVTLFPENSGDYIAYQGVLTGAGVFGAKLSPYIVTSGVPIITAWTMLMSIETGQPLMMCDSGGLTTERTAATTAVAVDLLAPKTAKRLAIVGSGAVAKAHLRHVLGLRLWDDVQVFSPSLNADLEKQAQWHALKDDLEFATSVDDAVKEADVVMLCTSSGTPVVDVQAIKKDALITSISTNVAQAHEIDPAFLKQAQVYCDYRRTTPHTAGEMQIAAEQFGWTADEVLGDLPELVSGTCDMPKAGRPVFFRSVGLGLEDIAIANAVYRAASHQQKAY